MLAYWIFTPLPKEQKYYGECYRINGKPNTIYFLSSREFYTALLPCLYTFTALISGLEPEQEVELPGCTTSFKDTETCFFG